MGEVIEGGRYLKIAGQTFKAGGIWYGYNWPYVTIETTGIGFQYNGGNYPYVFTEIGEPFNVLQYFIDKYGSDFEQWPHESIRICYDPDGHETTWSTSPYFYFGYEYDSNTNRVLFIAGMQNTSSPVSILHGYSNLGYTGMLLSGQPTETDIQLSNLFFFYPQGAYVPDVTAYMGMWGTGYKSFMNGQLVRQSDGMPMLFYDCATPNQHVLVPIPVSVGVRGAYMPTEMYYGPNPLPEAQNEYMALIWQISTYFGGGLFLDIPPALIDEEEPENIHYNTDPAPVGNGGNGQYIYDPDDGDGTLDFDPTNGAGETGFVHLYAPTKPQLKDLSSYLWNTDFWNTVAKLLNDPMDAIINLMRVPINLTAYRGDNVVCVCGNKSTGVSMAPLTASFIKLDLGKINLTEAWGNALDYPPYSACDCYLPYCGYVKLNMHDLYEMVSWGYTTLHCTYRVNTYTGECVAMLHMEKHSKKGGKKFRYMIGQYAGSLGFNIPVTASSYARLFSNIFNAGISAATAAATGGEAAGISAAANITNALTSAAAGGNPDIQRSGNFSGGSSPMEYYLPFIVLYIPVQALDAAGYAASNGLPSSCYRKIKECSGYCKVEAVELDGFSGTAEEAKELETLLKGGILV